MTRTRNRAAVNVAPARWLRTVAVTTWILLLAGCSGSSDSTSGAVPLTSAAAAAGAGEVGAPPEAARAAGAPEGKAADASGVAAGIPALDNRQIVRTADLQIRLRLAADTPDDGLAGAQRDALDTAVNKARAQLVGIGGFVADLRQTGSSASMVLRVPADRFDTFRAGAREWGEVTAGTESTLDITDQYTDVESRITSMRTSVDRIRTLLTQATAIGDVITIESELARREADLDALQGRRQVLADQVALGTISVTLTAVRDVVDGPVLVENRSGFLAGLAAGWSGLLAFLTGVARVLGAVLPFVPVVLVLVLVGWGVRRLIRRHRTPPAPATPAAPADAAAPA